MATVLEAAFTLANEELTALYNDSRADEIRRFLNGPPGAPPTPQDLAMLNSLYLPARSMGRATGIDISALDDAYKEFVRAQSLAGHKFLGATTVVLGVGLALLMTWKGISGR